MMPALKYLWLFLLPCWILTCTHRVHETVHPNPNAAFNFIIIGDASPFKDAIRTKIVEKYQTIANIEIANIETLKDLKAENHDVILIMDTCIAWSRFNPSLKSYLDRSKDQSPIVLFMTAGDPDWKFSYQGVDAITSASVMGDEEKVVEKLSLQIDRIIARKKS
jgi:hypothetical protein